jgi:tetratricopeptide (TPR) repeat protein
MKKPFILLLTLFLGLTLIAQEIERSQSNLPEISEVQAIIEEANGWVLQDNGSWLSAKNKILLYRSEQNRYADPLQKLGHQNFEQLEIQEVLIGDEQYIVLVIKYIGGYFEFPDLRQNFHKTKNARYVVFHAKKLEDIMLAASTFNEPSAINLDVFCSDNIIGYDKKQLTTQIAYNILRVEKMEEPSKFTMILALMPAIVNGEKLFRFRYVNLFNQESIYQKYLLPANKSRHFERSYFEVPFQTFIDFFGAIQVYKSDFNLQEPENFEDFYKRGALRYERKNFEGALSDFRAALKLKPDTDFWLLYAIMGSTQHQLENYKAAIRSFEKAILLEPSDDQQKQTWIRNYYNRGLSHLMLNNKEDACSDFQQAKLLGITDEEALKVIKKSCKGKIK